MFSAPPASAIWPSPSRSISAAVTIAWKPEPHKRLTTKAGVSMGMPTLSPIWRGK